MEYVKNTDRFYEVVYPHMVTVFRTAKFLTRCSADADDLTQITMLKAFKALDHLRDGTNAKAWLLTILRHANIDVIRARKGNQTSIEDLEEEPAEQIPWEPREESDVWQNPEMALNELSDQHVIDALRELPKEIRWTLLLSDVEGLDEADAATILNVPVGTIKSRLHRGRPMLRHLLAPFAQEMRMRPCVIDRIPAPSILAASVPSAYRTIIS